MLPSGFRLRRYASLNVDHFFYFIHVWLALSISIFIIRGMSDNII
jgi:hypothetical protein